MLGRIEAVCWGGPEDGAIVRCEHTSETVFLRYLPGTWTWEESTYMLEVTAEGRFHLKHIKTVALPK